MLDKMYHFDIDGHRSFDDTFFLSFGYKNDSGLWPVPSKGKKRYLDPIPEILHYVVGKNVILVYSCLVQDCPQLSFTVLS